MASDPVVKLRIQILNDLRSYITDWKTVEQTCRTLDSRGFAPGAMHRNGVNDIGSLFQYMIDRGKVKPKEMDYSFLIKVLDVDTDNSDFGELVELIKEAIEEYKRLSVSVKRPNRLSVDNTAIVPLKRSRNIMESDGVEGIPPIAPYTSENGSQFVIIINNFTRGDDKRIGTLKDQELLEEFLELQEAKGCRSTIKDHRDLCKDEMLEELTKAKNELMKTGDSYDRVMLFIFSHGRMDGVEGYYERRADRCMDDKERYITIDAITDMFDPTLPGKPKLIFINSCNGDKDNQHERMQSDSSFESPELPEIPELVEPDFGVCSLNKDPKYADILVSCASVRGFRAYRHTEEGTWYMNYLMGVFSKFLTRHHLLELITHTQLMVSSKIGTYEKKRTPFEKMLAQMPTFRSTLRQPVYLVPTSQIESPIQ